MDLAEISEKTGGRGGHDDPAIAVFPHLDEGRPGDMIGPVQVHSQDRLPGLGFHLGQGLVPEDTGVIDQDVHPAEGIDGLLDNGLAALRG